MATQQKPAKSEYQAKLQERAEAITEEILHSLDCSPQEVETTETIVFESLKQTAHESWKNGIQAGRKRAQQPQQ